MTNTSLKSFERRAQAVVPGYQIKQMPKWVAKIWWFDGIILGKTAYLSPMIRPTSAWRLAAHELSHLIDKQKVSRLSWPFRYFLSRRFRLDTEARAYAVSCLVYGYQYKRAPLDAIDDYTDILSGWKYLLLYPRDKVRVAILGEFAKMKKDNHWFVRQFVGLEM